MSFLVRAAPKVFAPSTFDCLGPGVQALSTRLRAVQADLGAVEKARAPNDVYTPSPGATALRTSADRIVADRLGLGVQELARRISSTEKALEVPAPKGFLGERAARKQQSTLLAELRKIQRLAESLLIDANRLKGSEVEGMGPVGMDYAEALTAQLGQVLAQKKLAAR